MDKNKKKKNLEYINIKDMGLSCVNIGSVISHKS